MYFKKIKNSCYMYYTYYMDWFVAMLNLALLLEAYSRKYSKEF